MAYKAFVYMVLHCDNCFPKLDVAGSTPPGARYALRAAPENEQVTKDVAGRVA